MFSYHVTTKLKRKSIVKKNFFSIIIIEFSKFYMRILDQINSSRMIFFFFFFTTNSTIVFNYGSPTNEVDVIYDIVAIENDKPCRLHDIEYKCLSYLLWQVKA